MKIKIDNIKNIDEGYLEIIKGKLNIKYGINGTGKSSITQALEHYYSDKDYSHLKPFKNINDEDIIPSVSIDCDDFSNIKIYNTNYINQYLISSSSNIMANSYEVFITPPNYKERCKALDELLIKINNIINEATHLKLLEDFCNSLDEYISKNAKNELKKTSKIKLLFENGNAKLNIPDKLVRFRDFLDRDDSTKWSDWHTKGSSFIGEKCPYCGENIDDKKDEILSLDKLFGKNIEIYSKIENILQNTKTLFKSEQYEELSQIISNKEITVSQQREILAVYDEAKLVLSKINNRHFINYSNLRDVSNLEESFKNKKIDISTLKYINSSDFIKEIDEYNSKIDELLSNLTPLKAEIGKLNSLISNNTKKNIDDINYFLNISGINYSVYVTEDEHVLIKPNQSEISIHPKDIMSYGEFNAFALALFVCEVKNSDGTLIVLDDPISSYDYNKKYAILHYLFMGKGHLKNKSVLLLTHELEPVIDIFKANKRSIPDFVNCCYLENNNGKLVEKNINDDELKSIVTFAKNMAQNKDMNVINRLIYLRKYLEFNDKYENTYDMISSLFKGNKIPKRLSGVELNESEISLAVNEVKQFIDCFDYDSVCTTINDVKTMIKLYDDSKTPYEKLEIFRIIYQNKGNKLIPDEIMKFINETFHIENSYVYQLNPYSYNQVPAYIINVCNREIAKFKTN